LSPGYGSVADLGRDEILAQINASGAEFLVVSLGAIKGHEWIETFSSALTPPVVSHLGAVVNYEAGTVKRAPRGFQRLGLEWLWRMGQEPALWRRYSRDGAQLAHLVLTRLVPYRVFLLRHRARLLRDGAPPVLHVEVEEGFRHLLRLQGAWAGETCQDLRDALLRAAEAGLPVTVDLAQATYIDSAIIGLLMLLRGHLSAQGQGLTVHGASPVVQRIFHYSCAEYLLDGPVPSPSDGVLRPSARTSVPLAG
jgi:N-acetylglucosaminyldiphosphoundecaprenol N-acetyl-beta-D-mannosaminyltransferase